METTFIIIAIAFGVLFWAFAIVCRDNDKLRKKNNDLKFDIKKLQQQIFELNKSIRTNLK